ncbi:acyl-CoA dehydrogenase family protein [Kitasatospora sp. NPDC054939]
MLAEVGIGSEAGTGIGSEAGAGHGPEGARADRRAAVRARIAAVDRAFGDPWDAANPVGLAAVLAADESGAPVPEALRRYDELGLNAAFVPRELGGALAGFDVTGAVFRPVFRRDARLASVGGISSLIVATVAWAAGTAAQRARVARALLAGDRLAIACHRLEHANIFFEEEFRAERDDSGYRLSGRKPAISNLDHATLILAFASTGDGDDAGGCDDGSGYDGDYRADGSEEDPADRSGAAQAPTGPAPDPAPDPHGTGSHSLFLLDRAELPGAWHRRLSGGLAVSTRQHLVGMELDDCPVPSGALVGRWGEGMAVGASAYPLINATLASMLIGLGDTALRGTVRFHRELGAAGRKRLQGRQIRSSLAGAFADLLVSDCLALAGTRSLHLLPDDCDVLTAAVKYLVPKLLSESMFHQSAILGGAFHTGDPHYAVLRKHLRDLDATSFGHVGSAVCQTAMVPWLPLLAADPRARTAQPPRALFRTDLPLPELDPERLARFGGADRLWGLIDLAATTGTLAVGPDGAPVPGGIGETLARQGGLLAEEAADLLARAAALGELPEGPAADARAFPLTERYALMLAAACCLGVWRGAEDGFTADPAWLAVALDRLLRRIGRPGPAVPAEALQRVLDELEHRYTGRIGFDLYAAELAG